MGFGRLVLTTENAEGGIAIVRLLISEARVMFVIVMIWSDDVPTVTFPKSTDGGVMEMSLDASGLTTPTTPARPPEQEGTQLYRNVPGLLNVWGDLKRSCSITNSGAALRMREIPEAAEDPEVAEIHLTVSPALMVIVCGTNPKSPT